LPTSGCAAWANAELWNVALMDGVEVVYDDGARCAERTTPNTTSSSAKPCDPMIPVATFPAGPFGSGSLAPSIVNSE
jgi:hypothetical protein